MWNGATEPTLSSLREQHAFTIINEDRERERDSNRKFVAVVFYSLLSFFLSFFLGLCLYYLCKFGFQDVSCRPRFNQFLSCFLFSFFFPPLSFLVEFLRINFELGQLNTFHKNTVKKFMGKHK